MKNYGYYHMRKVFNGKLLSSLTRVLKPTKPKKIAPSYSLEAKQINSPTIVPMKQRNKFVFKTEKTIREEHIELTLWQSTQLRAKLPKGIYWLQIERGGLIQWNWVLLQSYLLNGADSPETLALVEEYVSTLPQSA